MVPAGSLPSDVLYSSPVLGGGGGGGNAFGDAGGLGSASGGGDGGAFQEYGGVNPDLDPELAMVSNLYVGSDEEYAPLY